MLEVLRIAKMIHKKEAEYERILQEANLIKEIKHPSIPIIFDIEEDSNIICIIEEYISGKSLTEYMSMNSNLSNKQIAEFGIQLCNILEYLHNDQKTEIIHLDLKPDNIIIDDYNNIKVIDFDNAIQQNNAKNKGYGSVGFAAPEQYHRLKLDTRADIYSLGMLLMYMTNHGNIQSNAGQLRHNIFYPTIKKCIKHNSCQRYRSASDVAKALKRLNHYRSDKEDNETHNIYVYGTKGGVGTTHFCLCLSNFLARQGERVAYIERTVESVILDEAQKGTLLNNGFYFIHGVYLLPNYKGCIKHRDEEHFHYRIHDMGVWNEEGEVSELSNVILVCDYGYDFQKEKKRLKEMNQKVIVFMNHISSNKYYHIMRQEIRAFGLYRFPWIYEWHDKNDLFDEIAGQAMGICMHNSYFIGFREFIRKGRNTFEKIYAFICHRQE
jgi:hypothetical protein